jgi:hypothetical protein
MRTRAATLLIVVALLGLSASAAARPGGGETYSSGSGERSRGHDNDDDGDGGAAIALLIELCFRYPKVGLPLLLVALLFFALQGRPARDWDSVRVSAEDSSPVPIRRARPQLDLVMRVDADFSPVLFEDFVFRLYAAAHQYRSSASKLAELAPYLSAPARRALVERPPAGHPVTAVVIGQMQPYRVSVPGADSAAGDFGSFVKIGIRFESNYSVGVGSANRRFVIEEWLLQRAADARSKPPDLARRFACPKCGAPWRTADAAGTQKCASCGAVVDNGRFDWQVMEVKLRRESDNLPGLETEVLERGTSLPTVVDEALSERWAALMRDDPGVTDKSIAARLQYIYTVVNEAWAHGDLNAARPVLSDGLADYLRYWLDAYQSRGLRNVLEDMRLIRHELARLTRDRHYDALTVRLWATGRDYVIRTNDGGHVRGSRDHNRDYSEYWTLIRSSTRRGAPRADRKCGGCGAELTVTMAGACEHCGSHVTAGEFDWVLSKIEQDDAYQ